MANIIDITNALIRDVNVVTHAGGTTTTTYQEIYDRWNSMLQQDSTAVQRLADALIRGEDTELLYSLALAEEAGPETVGSVRLKVAEQVYPALRTEVTKAATDNYNTLREQFNQTATKLVEAIKTVDPDAKAEDLMSSPAKIRQAWADAPIHAADLNAQLEALKTAAKLAGALIPNNDAYLPLSTNPGNAHRRRVWEAWETTEGRAGRWTALTKLGVHIGAPDLDNYKPYRRPAELETKYKRGSTSGFGGQVPYIVDPEDTYAE
ncbi:hypothetical protein [Paenarthrobacter nitroguajacolicus]|uniref:hypothetical protein n=1 Tax=Paenarthrobacter nitroguajacolicus TaxID=211146 RepID=UPI000B1D5EC7|nr:hypothetical protein [Paenarthrobacter nitroguajacolicus]